MSDRRVAVTAELSKDNSNYMVERFKNLVFTKLNNVLHLLLSHSSPLYYLTAFTTFELFRKRDISEMLGSNI